MVPVRAGERLVAITFIESYIADAHQRAQVHELNEIAALEGLTMRWENRVHLDVVRQNLMRMWSSTWTEPIGRSASGPSEPILQDRYRLSFHLSSRCAVPTTIAAQENQLTSDVARRHPLGYIPVTPLRRQTEV